MKAMAVFGLASALGAVGCMGGQAQGWDGVAWPDASAMHVGEAHVMDARVNPLVPVTVASQGGDLAVSYGRADRARTVAHVNPESLRVQSSEPNAETNDATSKDAASSKDSPAAPQSDAPSCVLLDGGHFMLVWKHGSAEWGNRVMAQEFAKDGTPTGAAVVISPPNVDVMGTPQAVTTDGHHVVATFTGASDHGVQLLAVPIEVQISASGTERMARR